MQPTRCASWRGRWRPKIVPIPRKSIAQFFWLRVVKGDGDDCWQWTGRTDPNGYGDIQLYRNAPHQLAHRVSWELHNGQIPAGLSVLHHCDNPPCARPDHLFVGTQADNLADASRKGRLNVEGKAWKKHRECCPQGHPFDEANTYHRGAVRFCRACRAINERNRRRRQAPCAHG